MITVKKFFPFIIAIIVIISFSKCDSSSGGSSDDDVLIEIFSPTATTEIVAGQTLNVKFAITKAELDSLNFSVKIKSADSQGGSMVKSVEDFTIGMNEIPGVPNIGPNIYMVNYDKNVKIFDYATPGTYTFSLIYRLKGKTELNKNEVDFKIVAP